MTNKLTIDVEARIAQVVDSLDQINRKTASTANSMASAFAVVKAGIAGALGSLSVGAVKDEFDRIVKDLASLDDAAEKAGSSVEDLSETFNRFRVGGGTLDELTNASAKLVKAMQGADEESKGAGEAFAKLGIQTRDSAGNLRSSVQVLNEIAVALNGYADGSNKVALAQAIFGKAGAELLPKLRDLATETTHFGKITAEQAAAAEDLEKAIRRLSIESDLAKQEFLSGIIPSITRMVEQFRLGKEAAGGFWAAIAKFGGPGSGGTDPVAAMERLREEREKLQKTLEKEQATEGSRGYNGFARLNSPKRQAELQARLADIQKEIGYYQKLQAAQIQYEKGDLADSKDARATFKPNAPKLSGGPKKEDADKDPVKAQEALAKERVRIFLDAQKAIAADAQKLLDQSNAEGLESISGYFQKREALAEGAYQREIDALDKLIAAQKQAVQDAEKKGLKAEYEAQKEVEISLGKRVALERELRAFKDDNDYGRAKATREYAEATSALIAQLQALKGNSAAGAIEAFDKANRVLKERAEQGGDTVTLNALADQRRSVELMARYNDLAAERQVIEQDLATREARNQASLITGATTEITAMERLGDIRRGALPDLQRIAAAQAEIANSLGSPKLKAETEALRQRNEELARSADVMREKFGSIGENAMNRVVDDFLSGSKSLVDIAKDAVKQILAEFLKLQFAGVGRKLSTSLYDLINGGGGGAYGSALTASPGVPSSGYITGGGGWTSGFDLKMAPIAAPRMAKSGGQSFVVNQTINVSGGTSKAETYAAMTRAKYEAVAEMKNQLSASGRL